MRKRKCDMCRERAECYPRRYPGLGTLLLCGRCKRTTDGAAR